MPSRIFAAVLSPKPFNPASRPSSHAAFRPAMVSMPRCSWIARTFFGPTPLIRNISIRPGAIDFRNSSRYGSRPVRTSVVTFSSMASPMPRTLPSEPSATIALRSPGSWPMVRAAAE